MLPQQKDLSYPKGPQTSHPKSSSYVFALCVNFLAVKSSSTLAWRKRKESTEYLRGKTRKGMWRNCRRQILWRLYPHLRQPFVISNTYQDMKSWNDMAVFAQERLYEKTYNSLTLSWLSTVRNYREKKVKLGCPFN